MKANDAEDLVIRNLHVSGAMIILQDIASKGDINKTERKNIILSYLKKDKAFIERLCEIITGLYPMKHTGMTCINWLNVLNV